MNQIELLVSVAMDKWVLAHSATIDANNKMRSAVNALQVAVQTRVAMAQSMARLEANEDPDDEGHLNDELRHLMAQDTVVSELRFEVQTRIDMRSRYTNQEHFAYLDFTEAYDKYLAFENFEVDP